jgi:pyruvate dehydrogenase E1 component alpha subunit
MNEQIYIFLKKILEIRFTENFIADQFIKNKIFAFLHLCIGQEASAVGVCSALDNNDQVWGNHRSHGHYLAKGGNYEKMVLDNSRK